jgi:hypothetical protein
MNTWNTISKLDHSSGIGCVVSSRSGRGPAQFSVAIGTSSDTERVRPHMRVKDPLDLVEAINVLLEQATAVITAAREEEAKKPQPKPRFNKPGQGLGRFTEGEKKRKTLAEQERAKAEKRAKDRDLRSKMKGK